MEDPTERHLLVLYRNRNRDNDTYTLHDDTRKLVKGTVDLPSRVVMGRDWPNPQELTELQRDALVEILTGLREGDLRNYSVEIWLWDDSLIEKWW
jgi:hypothetical protein